MWTKLEFRAAHTQALQDKTQRVRKTLKVTKFTLNSTFQVILVVRDKAVLDDKEKLADDLQKYISLNTYLDTEDPWFWQKLLDSWSIYFSIYKWFPESLLLHKSA